MHQLVIKRPVICFTKAGQIRRHVRETTKKRLRQLRGDFASAFKSFVQRLQRITGLLFRCFFRSRIISVRMQKTGKTGNDSFFGLACLVLTIAAL